jgi:hypothetical protein
MRILSFARGRATALGVLSTGILCPCHALVGLVGLITGAAIVSPEAQDGIHAVYVPVAVLVGAVLLGSGRGRKSRGQGQPAEVDPHPWKEPPPKGEVERISVGG